MATKRTAMPRAKQKTIRNEGGRQVIEAGSAHGLLTPEGAAVPLLGVAIRGTLAGRAAEIRVAQRFRNLEAKPLEATYLFPLPESAAVCGLEVRTGERVLRGEVDERDRAFERYDDAMAAGHGAVLLDQERPNVYQVSVGNLLPGQEAVVEVRFLLVADAAGDGVRLLLPTTISPRYTPPDLPEEQLREIERTTPPYALAVPYGATLELDVEAGAPIALVESASHPLRAEIDGSRARVSFARGTEAMDRDVVIAVETREPRQARALVASHGGLDHLLVELLPELPATAKTLDLPREVWFLVDCSGSMEGDSIEEARRAVELCLRALRAGDRFQVALFGSTHRFLFEEPLVFSQETLDAAAVPVRRIEADLGGTEILAPLEAIAKAAAGRRVDLVVMTDGEVSNEEAVLSFLRANRTRVRVFSFGIGAGPSEFLLKGMARETGGQAEFVAPGERIEAKVLRQFARIDAPLVSQLEVDWAGRRAEQAPAVPPPVFPGLPLLLTARLAKGKGLPDGAEVTLRGTTPAGTMTWTARAVRVEGDAVPLLFARERIRDLEAGHGVPSGSRQSRGTDRARKALITLSKEYGVVCSETSYVAIEERADGERATEAAELRRVPIALTAGWHGIGLARMRNLYGLSGGRLARGVGKSSRLRRPPVMHCEMFDHDDDPACFFATATIVARQQPGRAEPTSRTDAPLLELLQAQRADGSFDMTPPLRKAAGVTLLRSALLRRKSGLDATTLATALAVAACRKRHADREDLWRLAVDKATAWLKANAPAQVDGLDLVDWALRELPGKP